MKAIMLLLYLWISVNCGELLEYTYNAASPPFIWEVPRRFRLFNVTSLLPKIPLSQQESKVVSFPKIFFISPAFWRNDVIKKYTRNKLNIIPPGSSSTDISKRNFLRDFLFHPINLGHRQLAVLSNASVDSGGHIFLPRRNIFYANGGCHQRFEPGRKPHENSPRYNRVISIAAMWTHTAFHFPMEALLGLAHLETALIQRSYLHISQINPYTRAWLKLLKVGEEKILTDTVFADELLLPEMSRCGAPSSLQLQWMRETFLPMTSHLDPVEPHVLLIVRNTSRVFHNLSIVLSTVSEVSGEYKLPVAVHNSSNIPSLLEQINMFKSAVFVITTHGAAELFLTFMPKEACVIEYNYPLTANMVYARLALTLGLNYRMNAIYELSAERLAQQMRQCLDYLESSNIIPPRGKGRHHVKEDRSSSRKKTTTTAKKKNGN